MPEGVYIIELKVGDELLLPAGKGHGETPHEALASVPGLSDGEYVVTPYSPGLAVELVLDGQGIRRKPEAFEGRDRQCTCHTSGKYHSSWCPLSRPFHALHL